MKQPLARAYTDAQSALWFRLAASLFFAGVTAASARIVFYLPGNPVPATLQVMVVLLSGLVLGSRWGAISQVQYLMMGTLGLPVFSNITAGPAAFAGPTGGYLFGFVLAAYMAGLVFEKLQNRTSLAGWIAGTAGMVCIYALGAPWLGVWLACVGGKPFSECVSGMWFLGVVPFIGIDFLKAIAASSLAIGGRSGRGLLHTFRNSR